MIKNARPRQHTNRGDTNHVCGLRGDRLPWDVFDRVTCLDALGVVRDHHFEPDLTILDHRGVDIKGHVDALHAQVVGHIIRGRLQFNRVSLSGNHALLVVPLEFLVTA